jgi:hypothetical protein
MGRSQGCNAHTARSLFSSSRFPWTVMPVALASLFAVRITSVLPGYIEITRQIPQL